MYSSFSYFFVVAFSVIHFKTQIGIFNTRLVAMMGEGWVEGGMVF